MSKISLKHSGGNVVSLNSPTSAPTSADVAFKLPNADGTSGQVLKTDGSGNLSFVAQSGGKFASYAVIADQKSQGTAGGTPPNTTAYNTRDLNTILTDPDTIVSVSSNQFTLQAGTYLISANAPAYKAARNQILIYNVTDSTVVAVGTSEYCGNSESVQTRSFAKNKTTISGSKVFDVRHRVGNADATYGFGVDANAGQVEIYTIVEIFKEA